MDQKLSSSPRAAIRSSGRPAMRRHRPRDSSSLWWTVTQTRYGCRLYPPPSTDAVDSSQAKAMASSLK